MDHRRSAIKLRQLEYFLAVAKLLHFSNAATTLHVTQPTLSHQIGELEAQVGTPLFNRSGKTVRLTEAGETFRAYATRALAELEAGRNALAELEGVESGMLRIGVSQSFVRKLLPPMLGEFITRYPGIALHVTERTAGEMEHDLADGLLDIGIAFAPAVLDDTELDPLIEERLMLVMRSSHPLATRGTVAMRELDGHRLALLSESFSTRLLIDRYLADAGAAPAIMCETNSIAVLLGFATASDVLAIIPESAISADRDITVLPLCDPSPIRVTALLWSRHSFRTAAARAFAALARQRFHDLLPVKPPAT